MKSLKNVLCKLLQKKLTVILLIILEFGFFQAPLYSQKFNPEDFDSIMIKRHPQNHIYSFRAGTVFNEDVLYLHGDFLFSVDKKTDLQLVLQFCFTPMETKVLKYESDGVYLNLSESRYIGLLILEKTFWFNNTFGFNISAGIGGAWFSYAGSKKDYSEPVAPALNAGLDINFSENVETGNAFGMRIGYELLNFKSETDHLGSVSLIYRF